MLSGVRPCTKLLKNPRPLGLGSVKNNDNSFYFVEIKGWMDKASKNRIENMGIFYPEIKLIVIDDKEYFKFKKEWQDKLKGWED